MKPGIFVTESASYNHPQKAGKLLKLGWRRGYITVVDDDTGEKIVSCLIYLPPATNREALERMLTLWTI
jgi:hypothetical protein